MTLCRIKVFSLFSVMVLMYSIGLNAKEKTQDKDNKRNPAKPPVTIKPFFDEEGVYRISKDAAMREQLFVYDPNSRKASIPDGPTFTEVGSPIPVRILSFQFTGGGARSCAIYRNVIIDFEKIKNEDFFPIGRIIVPKQNWQVACLVVKGHKKAFIDEGFTVFADEHRRASQKAPLASIEIISQAWQGDDLEKLPSVRGFIKRADGTKVRFDTGEKSKVEVHLDCLKEKSLLLQAQDSKGNKIEMPIPLPLKAAEKGLLVQSVLLRFGSRPVKKSTGHQ